MPPVTTVVHGRQVFPLHRPRDGMVTVWPGFFRAGPTFNIFLQRQTEWHVTDPDCLEHVAPAYFLPEVVIPKEVKESMKRWTP